MQCTGGARGACSGVAAGETATPLGEADCLRTAPAGVYGGSAGAAPSDDGGIVDDC